MPIAKDDVFDVFLSHAHVDAVIVETLGVRLEDEAKFRVWLDRWVLVPGESWQQEMARGLDQARTCVACIGHQTPEGWFREEIERALNRQVRDRSFRVIPVILPGGNRQLVNSFLELRTWVDFADGIKDDAFHILTSGVRGVPPGRNYRHVTNAHSGSLAIRDKLDQIRALRRDQLIDDDIALEYQRKLLDRLIEP